MSRKLVLGIVGTLGVAALVGALVASTQGSSSNGPSRVEVQLARWAEQFGLFPRWTIEVRRKEATALYDRIRQSESDISSLQVTTCPAVYTAAHFKERNRALELEFLRCEIEELAKEAAALRKAP